MDLTPSERFELNDRFGKNRCYRCGEVKDLSWFYRNTMAAPFESPVWKNCIECRNESFNNRSEKQVFTEHLSKCKSRAKEAGIEFALVADDLRNAYEIQEGCCNYTGRPIAFRVDRTSTIRRGCSGATSGSKRKKVGGGGGGGTGAGATSKRRAGNTYHNMDKVSVDRIDPARGYTRDNIQLVALHVNFAKLDLTEAQFVSMCRKVVETCDARGLPTPPRPCRFVQTRRQ